MIELLNDYQKEAIKTMKPMAKADADKYFCMKIHEEGGEISSLFAKHHYHGKPLDSDNVKDELSDILWYVANLANNNGFQLSEIATHNIDKLRKRHGEKYNQEFYKGK